MKLWPKNDPTACLQHTGIVLLVTISVVTLTLAEHLEKFPSLMALPITTNIYSVIYFLSCLTVLLGLGVVFFLENDKYKSVLYGLGFWAFLVFIFLFWISFRLINVKADSSKPQRIEVVVIGKHIDQGKAGSSEYLHVAEIDNVNNHYQFRVTYSAYLQSKVKDKLNIWIKKGYFNDPWVLSYEGSGKLL